MDSSILILLILSVGLVLAGKDYYKILGVNKTAKDAEVKRAFRKLALKYHPDRNSDKDAEAKFRDIAEAYEILSDPQKRRQYDQFGDSFNPNGDGNSFQGGFRDFDFSQFFKDFDASFSRHKQGDKADGNHHHKGFFNFDDLWSDEDTLFGGHAGHDNFFNMDFGDMFQGSAFDSGAHHVHKTFESRSSSSSGNGQNCRTITQRFGNTVTTFTQCN